MYKVVFALRHKSIYWVFLLVMAGVVNSTPVPLLAQPATPQAPLSVQHTTPIAPQLQAMVAAHIAFHNQADVDQLANHYDVWSVHHSPSSQARYVVALLSSAEMNTLRAQGYRVTVDDAMTAQLDQHAVRASAQQAGIPGYTCYRTVEETYSALAALAAAHPNLATWIDIGNSWKKETAGNGNGYDLYALVLTNQAIPGPKPKFLLMGAIHAREYTTAELATRFAEELVAKYNVDPDVTWLLDYTEIHIIPQANPDGRKLAETGQLWRKNTNNTDGCLVSSAWGVDLNRNSSFKWNNGGSSGNACDITYRGSSAGSEPETKSIQNYALAIFADQRGPNDTDAAPVDTTGLFISLHSYSELVLFPWGYTTTPAPNGTALQTLGRKFGYYNGYQVCTGPSCLYGTSGTTDDFTYGELGIASYTFEIGQNFFEQCSFFQANIIPQNMPALYYAAKVSRRPYEMPAGPDVLQASATITGTTMLIKATVNDTRYNSNGWGVEASQPISAARLTIDAPSWITGTQRYTMTAGDGIFDTNVESITGMIEVSSLAPGQRLIMLEGQDSAGNWGAPTGLFVTVGTPTATSTPVPTMPPTPTVTLTPTPIATAADGYKFYLPITLP